MCDDHKTDFSRRGFGAFALAGAAASLVPARASAAAKTAKLDCPTTKIKALALMCIDYRLVSKTIKFFDGGVGPGEKNYDLVALAGSSLSAVATRHFRHTPPGFWQQVQAAWLLHEIDHIVVVDHLGCGAFCAEYGRFRDTEAERLKHVADMIKLRNMLPAKARELGITDPLTIEFRMYPDPDAGPVPDVPPLVPELHP